MRLGDEGSGYWIGRAALRAVLRQADKRGPETMLVSPGVYDWSRDPGGRLFLRSAAKRDVPILIGFANSAPPIWSSEFPPPWIAVMPPCRATTPTVTVRVPAVRAAPDAEPITDDGARARERGPSAPRRPGEAAVPPRGYA